MIKNNFFGARLIALIACVLIAGCAPAPTATPIPPTSAPATIAPTSAPTRPVAPTATPTAVTLTDTAGRQVTLNAIPQRILSLSPSNTEILFALDLGSRVVAVDQFSDYPASVKSLPNIGGSRGKFDFEKIVELKPDLILAVQHNTPPEAIKKLEELKLTVMTISVTDTTFDTIAADILLVGKATGQNAQAQRVTDALKQKADALKTKLASASSKPRVFWEVDGTDATKPYTVAKGSFVNDLIALAGGVNIFENAGKPYPQVSAEQILAADPQVIILADGPFGVTPESVLKRAGWQNLSALKNNRVYPLDVNTGNMVSRPGPRVVDGLEAIAKMIRPELFK
jgi:iron complex transport system substrate-binding protein